MYYVAIILGSMLNWLG